MIRATISAFRRSPLAVTTRLVNRQLGSALKAPPMTIGIISSAFVSLQRVPCLVMRAFLLRRATGGQLASMAESGFEYGQIGGTGEAFETALSLR